MTKINFINIETSVDDRGYLHHCNSFDMTLSTMNKKYILNIWKSSGYKSNPTIENLIKELI